MVDKSIEKIAENFDATIKIIATSTKSLQERIIEACQYHLLLVDENDLPDNIREDFQKLKKELTSAKPEGSEEAVSATVMGFDGPKAAGIIDEIIGFGF